MVASHLEKSLKFENFSRTVKYLEKRSGKFEIHVPRKSGNFKILALDVKFNGPVLVINKAD